MTGYPGGETLALLRERWERDAQVCEQYRASRREAVKSALQI